MRIPRTVLTFSLAVLSAAPALAWIPKLDASTAKNVIDAAYRRRDPLATYLTADLSVEGGKFKANGAGVGAASGAVKVFDGADTCLSDWLSAPAAYDKSGSRPASLTLSGQADQLSFQAAAASDSFKTMSADAALKAFNVGLLPDASNDYGANVVIKSPDKSNSTIVTDSKTTVRQAGDTTTVNSTSTSSVQPQALARSIPDGQLRLDLVVAGLSDLKQRAAYKVGMKGPDGKLLAPVKSSYVNDWKADGAGKLGGTLVYYFEPTKAGINANDKIDLIVRTESDSGCVYAVNFDLGQFY